MASSAAYDPTKPGSTSVPHAAVSSLLPDLDKRIVAHIEQWRNSVESGTTLTIDKMLNCAPGCGCPPNSRLVACKAPKPGLPIEIVLTHLFPPDGTECRIPGVKGLTVAGPRVAVSLGFPKMIMKC